MIRYDNNVIPVSDRSTIVCVTNQVQCDRIIKAGRVLANLTKTRLLVVNVSNTNFSEQDGLALEHLYRVSVQYDAAMTVTYSDDPLKKLVHFIKHNKGTYVLTGVPNQSNSILHKLWMKFTHITFFTVGPDGTLREVTDKTYFDEDIA